MVKYIRWLKIIIGIFVFLNFFIFIGLIFQEFLIFRASEVPDSYKFKILIPHEEYIWKDTTKEVHQIYNAIYPTRKELKGYVFFLHGSQKNIEYHTQFIPIFTDDGYTVWMMDYPGFGKSKGERNEKSLYKDAKIMFDTFVQQYKIDPKKIIIVGKDLGTGIASELAHKVQTDKLVLISPYNNLIGLYSDLIPWFPFKLFLDYQFPTDQYLKDYKGQIGIFYGSNDMLIPHRNVRKLQQFLKPGDEYHEYETNVSDNVVDEKDFQSDLQLFLKK